MTDNFIPEINRCYRHHDRETFVSCGKCGKPLCPDCVHHGPVGVRCVDCLRPSNNRVSEFTHAPTDIDKARWISLVTTIIFAGIIGKISSMITVLSASANNRFVTDMAANIPGPNLFVSIIAGMLIGYIIWRTVGRTWNISTLWMAAICGAAVPVAGAVIAILISKESADIIKYLTTHNLEIGHLLIRTAISSLLSGGLAALTATNPRGTGF